MYMYKCTNIMYTMRTTTVEGTRVYLVYIIIEGEYPNYKVRTPDFGKGAWGGLTLPPFKCHISFIHA